MQPGPFNIFIAETCAVDEKTVTVYTRALKEAGLMTAGQGRYPPHMIPLDAARVLLALMATDRPSEAVEAVKLWQGMRLDPEKCRGELPDHVFSDGPTLEQALVRLVAVDPDPILWTRHLFPAFAVARNERWASFEWGMDGTTVAVFRRADRRPSTLAERKDMWGIRRSCLIAPGVLNRIAADMWADRFFGVDEKGLPLDLRHPWNDEGTPEESAARRQEIYAYLRKRDDKWRTGAE